MVRKYHGPHSKTGLKRSTQYGEVFHITKYNQSHEFLNVDQAKFKMHHSNDPNKHRRPCVRCPGEITAIARKGLDGILVEPPAPLSCKTNLPFARNLYSIETLFGSDLSFVLPKGRHSLTAKVRNVESGLIVRSCHLKYHVIVRRCKGFPSLKKKNIKMSCTAGTIWGSQCAFECRKEGESLSHRDSIVCNEDLEWIGEVPHCVSDIENTLGYVRDEEFCSQPPPPANGRFVCEAKNPDFPDTLPKLEQNIIESLKMLAPESVCHVQCDQSHSIPYHLSMFSTIQCINGAWNTTDIEFCYKKQPQRRRRHRYSHARNQTNPSHQSVQTHLDKTY
ncbi:uncharacterized protein LOC129572753 isoform X2 [Sitodiplosis mosellana]|nr:uncharacterized protein LOC129572753 isoform X2 [Sitodiplosis mosellana]XP_055308827.1 uncharacterized protein LOC129572753 isoform X2 [Sitodiplosis mosellana]